MQNRQKAAGGGEERRLHLRIMAPERSLVAVSGDYSGLPYHLTDISEGGMAFFYLDDRPLPLTDSHMDIYMEAVLQIAQLPVTVVADHKLEEYFLPKRRCSVRFGEMSQVQRVQLKAFITQHAVMGTSGS